MNHSLQQEISMLKTLSHLFKDNLSLTNNVNKIFNLPKNEWSEKSV